MTEQPAEKESIEQIKTTLRFRLQQTGVNNLIRHMVRDVCSSASDRGSSPEKVEPEEIVQEMYKRGLLKTILEQIQWSDNFEQELREKIERNLRLQNNNQLENEPDIFTSSSKERAVDVGLNGHGHGDAAGYGNGNGSVNVDGHGHGNAVSNGHVDDDEEDNLKSPDSFLSDESAKNQNDLYTAKSAQVVSEIPYGRKAKGLLNGKYEIKLEILGGRSFLDQIFEMDNLREKKRTFILHIGYKQQRFYAKPVPFHCEPKFQDDFTMNLGYFEDGSVLDLLRKYEPIKFILLEEDETGNRKLMSFSSFDWRSLLMSENCSEKFPVTLMGIGPECQVPVGVLLTRLTIFPSLQEILSPPTYAAQINAERSLVDEKERLFLVYVKQWWREFVEIRPQHSKRFVKIFSYDENTLARPIQTFVKTICADRFILTPFQAAWFVSLISLNGRDPDDLYRLNFSGKVSEDCQVLNNHWQSLITTLTAKSGGVEDHATLLCSLFLGFGMDAYVAIGTRIGGNPWVWVVTLDNANQPTFWESTTGSRFVFVPAAATELLEEKAARNKANEGHNLQTISCLFNDRLFYANIQAKNLIDLTNWDLSNSSKWKKIPECTLKSSTKFDEIPPELMPSTLNSTIVSKDIEVQLRILISETRTKHNLSVHWDNSLERLFGQELGRYEMEACCGVINLPGYFSTVIMKKIPAGYEFKGYPWNGSTRDARTIFHDLMRDPTCEDIIMCRGSDVKHSICIHVYIYPENILSIRLILACKFIPVD